MKTKNTEFQNENNTAAAVAATVTKIIHYVYYASARHRITAVHLTILQDILSDTDTCIST